MVHVAFVTLDVKYGDDTAQFSAFASRATKHLYVEETGFITNVELHLRFCFYRKWEKFGEGSFGDTQKVFQEGTGTT